MLDIKAAKARIDSMLRQEEGERLQVYRCKAGRPTIGVGATTYPDGTPVTMQDEPITVARMNEMLAYEIDFACNRVLQMAARECSTSQLVGLVLCGYNIGWAGLEGSTMMRLHRKRDYVGASRAFSLWDKSADPATKKKVPSKALAARRLRESAIYLEDLEVGSSPQAVEPESSLAKDSPIVRNSGIGGVLGGLVAVSDLDTVSQYTSKAKTILADFDISLMTVVGVLIIGYFASQIYWRWKQRSEGWV